MSNGRDAAREHPRWQVAIGNPNVVGGRLMALPLAAPEGGGDPAPLKGAIVRLRIAMAVIC
ncbi:hypothetical protein TBR22_A33940 [Luteitalea sp. TBR-22]|nr:hypothetical protein TBR22_A33940 [Luteitalea sp. TBR-22]